MSKRVNFDMSKNTQSNIPKFKVDRTDPHRRYIDNPLHALDEQNRGLHGITLDGTDLNAAIKPGLRPQQNSTPNPFNPPNPINYSNPATVPSGYYQHTSNPINYSQHVPTPPYLSMQPPIPFGHAQHLPLPPIQPEQRQDAAAFKRERMSKRTLASASFRKPPVLDNRVNPFGPSTHTTLNPLAKSGDDFFTQLANSGTEVTGQSLSQKAQMSQMSRLMLTRSQHSLSDTSLPGNSTMSLKTYVDYLQEQLFVDMQLYMGQFYTTMRTVYKPLGIVCYILFTDCKCTDYVCLKHFHVQQQTGVPTTLVHTTGDIPPQAVPWM